MQTQTQTQGFIQDSTSFLQQTETEFPVLYISKHNYFPVGPTCSETNYHNRFCFIRTHKHQSWPGMHPPKHASLNQRQLGLQIYNDEGFVWVFFLPQLSYWKKKHISSSSSLSIGEKRRRSKHIWVGLCVHLTISRCPCPSEGREPAPRKLFQWTLLAVCWWCMCKTSDDRRNPNLVRKSKI